MTKKVLLCDWCDGGKQMTECGPENCDHCFDTKGKIRKTQSQEAQFYDFDAEEAMGIKLILPREVKTTIGMHRLFNKDEYNDLPLIVVEGIYID